MTTDTKTAIHTIYRTKDGAKVPSVTTVLGILAKPALIDWAWKLGIAGQDYRKVRDGAADIGTLAHAMIIAELTGKKAGTDEYSPDDVSRAENALIKFYDWQRSHKISGYVVESPFVHEEHKYGGTIDFYANIDGEPSIVDFKTGKGLYREHFIQVAAYRELLMAQSLPVSRVYILRIGRDETEGFEERYLLDTSKHLEIFLHCLAVYQLQNEI